MVKKLVLTIFFTALLLSGLALAGSAYGTSESFSTSSASDVSSTEWSITWNHTYVDSNLVEADSVIQTADGGFLLTGKTPFNAGSNTGNGIALLKVDSSGNLQWNKTYEAVGNALSKWLIQTSDGAYALAGQYGGGFWLAKIEDTGNMQWNKTYIGEGFSWAVSLTQTSDGGYALTGQTNATPSSSTGARGVIWLVKTDSLGNKQWNKTLGDGMVNSVIQTSDGEYALAGNIGSNLPDYLLIKTSSTGDMQWTKTYGSQDNDVAYTVVQTSDGGYALGGWMWLRSNGGGPNLAIVKTDTSGNEQWTKYFGAGFARCMVKTSDGDFALAGDKIVVVDAAGNEQWELSFGNSSMYQAYSVIETQDGGYAVAGANLGYGSTSNAWLAKISSNSPLQSPTPSPTVPEFAPTTALILIMVTFTVTFVISVALRKRNGKLK